MKKLISLLLCVLSLCLCCITPVFAAERGDDLSDSGTYIFYLCGDVDLDGSVSGIDTVYTMRYIVGLHKSAHMFLADVDNDGWVTIMDVTQMQRYLVGMKAREYGDSTGVLTSTYKDGVIDDVHDCITTHFGFLGYGHEDSLSYEAEAAFLTILDTIINQDTRRDTHDALSLTHMYFRDPFYDAPSDMPHVKKLMRAYTDSGLSLYECLEHMTAQLMPGRTMCLSDYRMANYYYDWIYEHENYPTPMI